MKFDTQIYEKLQEMDSRLKKLDKMNLKDNRNDSKKSLTK